MSAFTPQLGGGVLIGLAATLLLLVNGRVAGVSGITAGLLPPGRPTADWAWRAAFVAGLVSAPVVMRLFGPLSVSAGTPLTVMAAAGLLVGYGTVLGNGCTSGHGVCGIARLSVRSLVATVSFMLAGAATVFVVRHIL